MGKKSQGTTSTVLHRAQSQAWRKSANFHESLVFQHFIWQSLACGDTVELIEPDVASYINDEVASHLYGILGAAETALGIAKDWEQIWIFEDKANEEKSKRDIPFLVSSKPPDLISFDEKRMKHLKVFLIETFKELRDFWKSVEDEKEAKKFEEVLNQ